MKETNIQNILDEIEIYLDEILCEYNESDLAWKKAVDSLELVNTIREIIIEG